MPTRYFCDIDGTEIASDDPYFLLNLSVTNNDGGHYYREDPSFYSRTTKFPVATNHNMVCKGCAIRIAELVRVIIPTETSDNAEN